MSKEYLCRLCNKNDLNDFLEIDNSPKNISVLLNKEMLENDKPVKVKVYKCENCGFVQLKNTLDNDYYEDYLMTTSHTKQLDDYLHKQSDDFIRNFNLERKKIIDVGCGDGHYVSILSKKGMDAFGIEPSKRFSQKGKQLGLNIFDGYVSTENLIPFAGEYEAFVTRQVLEHVSEPVDFLTGIAKSLKKDSYGLVEVPSLEQALLNQRYYDFFPDHLNYFSVRTLSTALEMAGFLVLNITRTFNNEYLQATVIYSPDANQLSLKSSLVRTKQKLRALLNKYKNLGKVAVWGSGAKGLVALASAEIYDGIEYIIDNDINKQGLFSPVTHLPIVSPAMLKKNPVVLIIITALAFKKEILEELKHEHHFHGEIYILDDNLI